MSRQISLIVFVSVHLVVERYGAIVATNHH